jgi:hypothetical protein
MWSLRFGALNERNAESFLQPRDFRTDSRVRLVEQSGGLAEAAGLNHLHKHRNVVKVHAALCILLHKAFHAKGLINGTRSRYSR